MVSRLVKYIKNRGSGPEKLFEYIFKFRRLTSVAIEFGKAPSKELPDKLRSCSFVTLSKQSGSSPVILLNDKSSIRRVRSLVRQRSSISPPRLLQERFTNSSFSKRPNPCGKLPSKLLISIYRVVKFDRSPIFPGNSPSHALLVNLSAVTVLSDVSTPSNSCASASNIPIAGLIDVCDCPVQPNFLFQLCPPKLSNNLTRAILSIRGTSDILV
mmetsp:Transcript_16285/g.24540  ORF Transcript_16285/g.24540 Transcript_16285/m.24540 type:complete len:213 (-) Transcript_16285:173-811(-)